MPPSVSSENTTPKPNVSSAALRSQTVISCAGSSCLVRAAKYSPPGPPPMTAMRIGWPQPLALALLRPGTWLAQPEALQLAARRVAGSAVDELDARGYLYGAIAA